MKVLFSTDPLHPCDRFEFWHETARKTLLDHDCTPTNRLDFGAQIAIASLGDMALISCRMSSMEFARTQRHMGNSSDEFLLLRQVSGELHLEQNGRSTVLHPGDLALLDPCLPYSGRNSTNCGHLVLKVPRRSVTARVGLTADVVALPIRATKGLSGWTSDMLGALPQHADALGSAARLVGEQALDLFAAALSNTIGAAKPRLSRAHVVVLTQIRGIIEQRLSESDLSPQAVAAAAGVSVRYANKVLSAESSSLARLIQTRRLERCRQALADPAQSSLTISEIAYRWGFSDMTHFARSFRSMFGALPREYRAHQVNSLRLTV